MCWDMLSASEEDKWSFSSWSHSVIGTNIESQIQVYKSINRWKQFMLPNSIVKSYRLSYSFVSSVGATSTAIAAFTFLAVLNLTSLFLGVHLDNNEPKKLEPASDIENELMKWLYHQSCFLHSCIQVSRFYVF